MTVHEWMDGSIIRHTRNEKREIECGCEKNPLPKIQKALKVSKYRSCVSILPLMLPWLEFSLSLSSRFPADSTAALLKLFSPAAAAADHGSGLQQLSDYSTRKMKILKETDHECLDPFSSPDIMIGILSCVDWFSSHFFSMRITLPCEAKRRWWSESINLMISWSFIWSVLRIADSSSPKY